MTSRTRLAYCVRIPPCKFWLLYLGECGKGRPFSSVILLLNIKGYQHVDILLVRWPIDTWLF